MDAAKQYENILERLGKCKYLSTPKNNKLLKAYLESKFNGGFGRIVYDKSINSKKTAIKKAMIIRKVDAYFKKDFPDITEDELLKLRDDLNSNAIMANSTLIKHQNSRQQSFTVEQTDRPLSYRTKSDIKVNFIEFYHFIMESYYGLDHRFGRLPKRKQ